MLDASLPAKQFEMFRRQRLDYVAEAVSLVEHGFSVAFDLLDETVFPQQFLHDRRGPGAPPKWNILLQIMLFYVLPFR